MVICCINEEMHVLLPPPIYQSIFPMANLLVIPQVLQTLPTLSGSNVNQKKH